MSTKIGRFCLNNYKKIIKVNPIYIYFSIYSLFSAVKICLSVYISLMTSGKFVRLYSLSVVQGCDEHQKGSCVLHIFDNTLG